MSSLQNSFYARPYAEAAFRYAKLHADVNSWDVFLKNFAALFSSEEIQKFVSNPLVEQTQLVNIVVELLEFINSQPQSKALYGTSSLNQYQVNFLLQLAINKRLVELPAITYYFERLRDEDEAILHAVVSSAFPLDATILKNLEQKLTDKFHKKMILETKIDSTLIGGLKIQINDYVLDTSIANTLSQLRQSLTKGNPLCH